MCAPLLILLILVSPHGLEATLSKAGLVSASLDLEEDVTPSHVDARRPEWKLAPRITGVSVGPLGTATPPPALAEAYAHWEAAAADAARAAAAAENAARAAAAPVVVNAAPPVVVSAGVLAPPQVNGAPAAAVSGLQAAQETQLRVENDRLRQDNLRLHDEDAILRKEMAELRKENTGLQDQDLLLRSEGGRLRGTVASLSHAVAATRALGDRAASSGIALVSNVGAHGSKGQLSRVQFLALTIIGGMLLCMTTCFYCIWSAQDEMELDEDGQYHDEGEEERERRKLKKLIEDDGGRSCCWCMHHPVLMTYICGVLSITFIGGCVLWQMGILQPILAQCIMYVYIMGIVVAFMSLLFTRLWHLFKRFVSYIMTATQKVKGVFHILPKKMGPQAGGAPGGGPKMRDMFDDDLTTKGPYDTTFAPPMNNRRPRGAPGMPPAVDALRANAPTPGKPRSKK